MKKTLFRLIAGGLLLLPSVAFASDGEQDAMSGRNTADNLPPSQSDYDPQPAVAAPGGTAERGVVAQAGVGGVIAYGRAGVVELGGTMGFNAASGVTSLALTPSIGYFLADNLEASALLSVQSQSIDGASSTLVTALIEPSYHLPLSNTMFIFAGIGMGLGYVSDKDIGFAMSPRLGMNFLIGRSGILSPSAFFSYSTVGVSGTTAAPTLQVRGAYGVQLGYTIML